MRSTAYETGLGITHPQRTECWPHGRARLRRELLGSLRLVAQNNRDGRRPQQVGHPDVVALPENCVALGYNRGMVSENPSRRGRKSPPPGDTGQEAAYLRFLSEKQVPVTVKLRDGESVSGWIEYFDDRMIRLTREGRPNLFIYKQQIRTITEQGRRAPKNDAVRNIAEETRRE
jgi:host factor-I protein